FALPLLLAEIGESLGELSRQVARRPDEERPLTPGLAVGQDAVADALLFQVGEQAGPQEGTLAAAALAVQHHQPRAGVPQDAGEAEHVAVPAGEQRPVAALEVMQRPV